MAELDYGDLRAALGVSGGRAQTGTIGNIINIGGALMSLALIAGIAVWGYELMLRDVTGVPVVRALDGPMRVQPDDPGGLLAAHQGLSVNRVQADGIAEPVAERLVLAPSPVEVSDADQAGVLPQPSPHQSSPLASHRPVPAPRGEATPLAEAGEPMLVAARGPEITAPALLTEEAPLQTLPETVTDGEGTVIATAPTDDDLSETDTAVAAALALADQIAAEAAPLADVLDADAGRPKIIAISATIAGISRSPRPVVRPVNPNPTPVPASLETGGGRDVDPASIPAGTRLVQLGAYETAIEAQQEWDKLYARFTAYLEDKGRVIQRAESSGRVFYRLRAVGFDDLADTRRFCSVLLAENTACIPVKVRE